uniref:Uncharacterized protein n=1 Tax=Pseudo-nitzschia australis TaxID=44445 RepID=A0A7S4AQ67_9STRA|mmetsp:Transcript_354/g.849  ORF Transcript_354/g.849 Transcript_354/m.849 type:complete len:471 (-) Transcript_354:526-1938(-)
MFKRRSSIAGNDSKFFPQDEDPRGSILSSENSSSNFYDVTENTSLEEEKDISDMGLRSFEELGDSVVFKPGNEGKKEDSRRASSSNHNHSQEGAKSEREQQGDVTELVKLIERSRSSVQMKTLLLKILNNENKFEELKQFLKDDANTNANTNANTTVRRNSTQSRRSSASSSAIQRDPTKNGTRRTTRTRNIERGTRSNGSSNKMTTNDDPASPGSGKQTRIRSPELLIRKKALSDFSANNQKSNVTGSASSTQLRPNNRRNDMKKIHNSFANLGPDHASSSGNRNQSFNKRTISAGSFSRQEQKGLDGSQNAIWDVPTSSSRRGSIDRRGTTDRLRSRSTRNLNLEKDDDDSNDDAMETEDTFPPSNNSYSQLGRGRGQREQTHGLHSLLDDLRLGKDSNSSNKDVEEEEDTTTKKKKNIRKFLSRQLSIKNFTGKEKSGSMDFTKMNDNGLADVKEPNEDSISSLFGE